MTDKKKPNSENLTDKDLESEEKLKGKLKKAEFPEMKHQADAALGEEEE